MSADVQETEPFTHGTVENLEKVLSDLMGNRTRLVEHIKVTEQQLNVQKQQVLYFDTMIATVRYALGDGSVIDGIDALKNQPEAAEVQESPLGAAGAGDSGSPAPAGEDGSNGATA